MQVFMTSLQHSLNTKVLPRVCSSFSDGVRSLSLPATVVLRYQVGALLYNQVIEGLGDCPLLSNELLEITFN